MVYKGRHLSKATSLQQHTLYLGEGKQRINMFSRSTDPLWKTAKLPFIVWTLDDGLGRFAGLSNDGREPFTAISCAKEIVASNLVRILVCFELSTDRISNVKPDQ